MRAYEAATPDVERIPSHYALLSSKVTSVAVMHAPLTRENLQFLVKTPVPLTARSFFTRVLGSGRDHEVDEMLGRYGIAPGLLLDQGEAFALLPPVFDEWQVDLSRIAGQQRTLLHRYLDITGITDPEARPLLVDVGWSGTIQRAVAAVRGQDLHGVYLGLLDNERTRATPGLHGWLDARRGGSDQHALQVVFDGLRLLEVMLAAADEGSVRAFEEPEEPKAVPRTLHLDPEFPTSTALLIEEAQEEALRFIRDFRDAERVLRLVGGPSIGSLGRETLLRLMERPTRRQLDDFAALPFDGSYGERRGTVGLWGDPAELARIVDPRRVVRGVRRRTHRLLRNRSARGRLR